MAARFTIVGIGEALFDVYPDQQFLGGAPLNFAVHAHQLARKRDGEGIVASRLGQDHLAEQIHDELKQRDMNTWYLQADPDHPTGKVFVEPDAPGGPAFDIVENVAWDWLHLDPDLESLAGRCEAVCFGTLAQRNGEARNTIYRYLDAARRAVRLFDVNLRQNDYSAQMLRRSCERATVLKLNREELAIVARQVTRPADDADEDALAGAILAQYRQLKVLALTRGEEGTVLYRGDERVEGAKAHYPAAEGADAVGAGDAAAAAIAVGLVLRKPVQAIADLANHAGAYVASQPGATPELPEEILEMVG